MTPVGFEPTPFRNGALSHRLRPLGQTVLSNQSKPSNASSPHIHPRSKFTLRPSSFSSSLILLLLLLLIVFFLFLISCPFPRRPLLALANVRTHWDLRPGPFRMRGECDTTAPCDPLRFTDHGWKGNVQGALEERGKNNPVDTQHSLPKYDASSLPPSPPLPKLQSSCSGSPLGQLLRNLGRGGEGGRVRGAGTPPTAKKNNSSPARQTKTSPYPATPASTKGNSG